MGTRMPILRRVSSGLSTALLEWILMLLLFIDAVYSFLVTRFARLCKLPAPCPFCSRLDHVLGNEKLCFYRELICKTHKSEISSLAFCHLHQKLAGAQSMCERCCEKTNDYDKIDEAVMGFNVFDNNQGRNDVLNSPPTRICSCCGQHFKQRSLTLSSRKTAELLGTTEAVESPKIYTDYSVAGHVDECLEPKDIYHQSDHMSHERGSVLQMTSDSETEVPCADDGKSSHPREANVVEEDLHEDAAFELPDIPYPVVVKESERNVQKKLNVTDFHDTSLAYPVTDDHPDGGIDGNQVEEINNLSQKWAPQHDPSFVIEDSGLKDAKISQIPVASNGELPQVLGEIEQFQSTSEGKDVPYTSQFTILEQHYTTSGKRNTKDNLKQVHGPEITGTSRCEFSQRSALANDPDDISNNHVSQVPAGSETIGDAEDNTKKIEPTGDMATHGLKIQGSAKTGPRDFIEKDEAHISADAVRPSSEVPQDHSATGDYPKTSETTIERRPSLSTQISMNEAYRLAIGSKSSLPSPTLTDVILGKDSTSSINEELRLLLSQLSASRGLEAPWIDPGPSPRAYGRGDELVVQNITKRISLERNASGLESLDESIVSEIEGESTIDRLRRQIDLDRKSIHLLCRELEEERNASAIAASQALAMITKLQDEKAAMQMEASHYQRMMEEQAEYDGEALAKANELLAEREQQIEELEAELENYRRQFGHGPTETQANQAPLHEENTDTTLPTPRGTKSLMSFEEERAHIANCLKKLEQKLQCYSNNSSSVDLWSSDAIEDDLSSKASVVEDDLLHHQESVREREEHISLGNKTGASTMSGEADITTVHEEIASLNRRLKTLEGDHSFLEHSINSLRNGNEGLMFIQEIACNLRELRTIAIERK